MLNIRTIGSLLVALLVTQSGCARPQETRPPNPDPFVRALSDAALERTEHEVRYDGRYLSIEYPGGDVPPGIGVCTDVVIRSYRHLGTDLQQLVHEEMSAAFAAFPKRWGLDRPDPNIDHRRVPNLEVYFERRGTVLPRTRDAADYAPGDLVTWDVGGRPHIGILVDRWSDDRRRPLVVHNIGSGPVLEDMLFDYPITGHFSFVPDRWDVSSSRLRPDDH